MVKTWEDPITGEVVDVKNLALDVITDLANTDEVYLEVSREHVKKVFAEAREIPTNPGGEEDDDYECGDLQFIFEKGTDNLQEILLFPVYRYDEADGDDNFENGDFIDASDKIYNDRGLLDIVKEALAAERA